jgi:4-hydroxybenzoate polyprenyltransferase
MIENIKSFFKLVRWFHELVVIIPFLGLFLVIDYYNRKSSSACELSSFNFSILCFCVQLQIAGGCVLNDIMDRNIDRVNKPLTYIVGNRISLYHSKVIYLLLTLITAVISAYISYYMFSEWAYISIGVFILSILYDIYLKRSPLLGNILMAALTAFIPLILFFFAKDCIQLLNNYKVQVLIYLYAIFPFLIIIPRELSLDISDMEGDKADGCKTLPILIGVQRSKMVVTGLLFIIIILSIPVSIRFNYLLVSLITIDILLLIYIYRLRKVETRLDYIKIGRFLWFIMIFGLIEFTVVTLI